MKRAILLCSLFLFLFHSNSSAQSPTLLWDRFYTGNGDNSERFNKIVPDGSGNYVAVGYTVKQGNYRDVLTVKFDSNGDTLWWRTKNGKGSFDDEGVTVALDVAGNVYAVSYTHLTLPTSDLV